MADFKFLILNEQFVYPAWKEREKTCLIQLKMYLLISDQ